MIILPRRGDTRSLLSIRCKEIVSAQYPHKTQYDASQSAPSQLKTADNRERINDSQKHANK